MKVRTICLGAILIALALVGCSPYIKYENPVAACSWNDGRYRILIKLDRDSSQSQRDVLLTDFVQACELIGAQVSR